MRFFPLNKMKKIFRNIILLLVASALILTGSCKKYPDGPLLSLRTKAHRIEGTWDVEYFSINGYDSTSYLKSKRFYAMYSFDNTNHNHDCFYQATNYDYHLYGIWKLEHNKENLSVFFSLSNQFKDHLGPYRAERAIWGIRRLTEEEMWLKNTYTDGREYFVKFKLFKNL
jgi:hypothetical protein